MTKSAGADPLEFHGAQVVDPQQWLNSLDSDEAQRWVAAQDLAATSFLEAQTRIAYCREFMRRNYCRVDPPWQAVRGERTFFLSRRPDRSQLRICVRGADGCDRALVDPADSGRELDPDNVAVSPTGRYIAYALSAPGAVLASIEVYDLEASRVIESPPLATVAPMIAWHPGELGYYHSRFRQLLFPEEREDGVYWHALGADPGADPCVCHYGDGPGHLAYAVVASDYLLLVTYQFSSGLSGVSLCRRAQTWPATASPPQALSLFDDLECANHFLGEARGRLYFQTTCGAPMGQIVAINPLLPARSDWTTVVAEGELPISRPEHFPGPAKSAVSDDTLLVSFVEHAHDVLWQFDPEGRPQRKLEFPVASTIDAVLRTGDHFRVYTQSFLEPRVIFRCGGSSAAGALDVVDRVDIPEVDYRDGDVQQVFVPARDGARVPMYLVRRRGHQPRLPGPVLLYGYGGFGQSITPEYMPDVALWLALGGTFALANIRGGGEYGEAWHAAGSGERKQTSFDDFYAAAEYLIADGYAEPGRLAIKGISNGGLLTAVCVNQRPDLFAAVVSEVPLVDVLGLERTSAGRSVTAEYGRPSASRAMFEVIRRYSPLHNLAPDGAGPPQWVVAAEKDFSAAPSQVCRYVAERQTRLQASGLATPVLLRMLRGAGHTKWDFEVASRVVAEELAFLHHFAGRA